MPKNLRVLDPGFGDSLETSLRRFLLPMQVDTTNLPLQMRLDVSENKGAYVVKADLPGAKKEDITVRIDGNIIQIEAEVKQEAEAKDKEERMLRSERHHGCVSRTFSLGHDVDEEKATAYYIDGVLRLTLPKKATVPCHILAIQ